MLLFAETFTRQLRNARNSIIVQVSKIRKKHDSVYQMVLVSFFINSQLNKWLYGLFYIIFLPYVNYYTINGSIFQKVEQKRQ